MWAGIQQARIGMALCSQQHSVLAADSGYATILRRDLTGVTAMTMHEMTHPEDRACNDHLLAMIRQTQEPFRIVKRYIAQDRVIWVENHVSWLGTGAEGRILLLSREMPSAEAPCAGSQGRPVDIGIAGYIRDMTGQLAEMADAGGLPTTASALRLIDLIAFEEIEDNLSAVGPIHPC